MALSTKLRVHNDLAREALAEFLGTFILLSFGDGSVAQMLLSQGELGSALSIHLSWGLGVMMGVFVAGGVSGAHLNPAVTGAMACLGRLPWRKAPVYMLAQYLGAFIAAACVYLVYYDALAHYDGGVRDLSSAGIFATYPQTYVTSWNCFGDQIFGTALLLIGILAITDPDNMAPSKAMTALCVGLLVVAIGMTFGLNCGYAINPARDLGPRIFTAIGGWGLEPFNVRNYNYFWIPVVATHLGAIIGSLVYQLCVGFHWPRQASDAQMNVRGGPVSQVQYDGPYESQAKL
ncbi:AQP10-like protein [Mya arenaria]|uniref:AQP10-like protein n=1 Tax=Mya arenaria TaxID=6604 RepID=A0ABY7DMS5_MYAAR|nr:aquaporin-7-like [Mya arenaria]WAQ99001.1 AQP10-like protein [Mya arenaria]